MAVHARFALGFGAGILAGLAATVPAVSVVGNALGPTSGSEDRSTPAADGTSPLLRLRPVIFVPQARIDAAVPSCGRLENFAVPLRVRWSARDTDSGVARYEFWGYGAAFGGFSLQARGPALTSARLQGTDHDFGCSGGGVEGDKEFFARVVDRAGNAASSRTVTFFVTVWQENGHGANPVPVSRTGAWQARRCACHNHRRALRSTERDASLTYSVETFSTAQRLGVVAATGPGRGELEVRLDQREPVIIDTYAPRPRSRVIVWQRSVRPGPHRLTVVNRATPTRPAIAIDSLLMGPGLSGAAPGPGS